MSTPGGWVRGPDDAPAEVRAAAETVASWLARRDIAAIDATGALDLIVVAGNAVLRSCQVAAAAWLRWPAATVVLAGGVGHSTPELRARACSALGADPAVFADASEAAIMGAVVESFGVSPASILLEDRSTNTGENAAYSLQRVRAAGQRSNRVLLVQDPTLARRTHATFARAWRDDARELLSFAPFLPVVAADGPGEPSWSWARFVSLLTGEVRRLTNDEHGYGPLGAGFIDGVDVPPAVRAAAGTLQARYPELTR